MRASLEFKGRELMWHFEYVIPSFMILAVILLHYFTSQHISVRVHKVFFAVLYVEFFTILIDIVSSYFCDHFEHFSYELLVFINLLFYILFLLRSYVFFIYSYVLSNRTIRLKKERVILATIPLIILEAFVISTVVNKYIFYIDENGFNKGRYNYAIYICLFFYVFLSIVVAIFNRKKFNRKKYFAYTILFNMVLFIGGIVRILLPNYLIMDTTCVLTILMIYLCFENPELYIDRRTSSFNYSALNALLFDDRAINRTSIKGFYLRNYREFHGFIEDNLVDELLRVVANAVKIYGKTRNIFYIRRGGFIVCYKEQKDFSQVQKEVTRYLDEYKRMHDIKIRTDLAIIELDEELAGLPVSTKVELIKDVYDSRYNMVAFDRILISVDDYNKSKRELEIKSEIEWAIDNNDVEIYIQPIVEIKNKKVVGGELLARIKRDNGSLLMPGEFISVAERYGLMNKIGYMVFSKACKYIKENDLKAAGIEWLNFNVSPSEFLGDDLSSSLCEVTNKYGVDRNFIHIEIVEEFVEDFLRFKNEISKVHRFDFNFVLDDYGVGYSNLMRLNEINFINIKLDKSLVRAYCDSGNLIVATMIKAFKELGYELTAEGVESEDMVRKMTDLGVDYIQGFYYSKAVPVANFLDMVKEINTK